MSPEASRSPEARAPGTGARRWPDLMIGALVVLLLGGFGTLLLRGPPQPGPQATLPATPTAGDATTIPGAPGSAATGTGDATPPPAATTTEPTTDAPANGGTTATDPAPTPTTPEPAATGTTLATPDDTAAPVIEAAPIGAPLPADPKVPEPATTPKDADAATATDPATAATDPAAANPAASTGATPRAGGAVATSERRVPLRSDYRITLGTFSSAAAAQGAAAPVQGIGYTVYPIDLGTQVVAQIGPFADEQTAREALADVQRAYPGAVLYPPRNKPAPSTAPASAAATPAATPAATAATPVPAATPAAAVPAPAGPTYLQVGAFDRVESAQNLVQQLRDLGYAPTVNAPEGKKVTVLVGPYEDAAALTRTESRLRGNGLDSFRVR